jgi:hypothetical protein
VNVTGVIDTEAAASEEQRQTVANTSITVMAFHIFYEGIKCKNSAFSTDLSPSMRQNMKTYNYHLGGMDCNIVPG